MAIGSRFAALVVAGSAAAAAGCAGVSVGQGASAMTGGLFNLIGETGIVIGRGAADVGDAVLDTVPFPGPAPGAVPAPPMAAVPAPPQK